MRNGVAVTGVVVRRARSAWTREEIDVDVPAALRADGSMVADGSMMPFPMPPFDMDMVWTGCACTEYIPCGAGAAELAGQSGERRASCGFAAQMAANGGGKVRLANGWGGRRIRQWQAVVVGGRLSVVGRRKGQRADGRCRVCCDGRALQDPEVPAGGAKQRTGLLDWSTSRRPRAKVKRQQQQQQQQQTQIQSSNRDQSQDRARRDGDDARPAAS